MLSLASCPLLTRPWKNQQFFKKIPKSYFIPPDGAGDGGRALCGAGDGGRAPSEDKPFDAGRG
jgi:hypothetical protein